MRSVKLALLLALVLMASTATAAGLYLNSSEPGCDGSDPTVVWCDDFEHDATGGTSGNKWYGLNCDQAQAGGLAQTKGWCGTIYANSYIPNSVVCGGQGAAGSSCAATSGLLPGPNPDNTGNMGDHDAGPASGGYQTLYFRLMIKYSVGHSTGPLKTLTFNKWGAGNGGISIGGFGNGGGPWSMCPVQDCNSLGFMNPQNTGCAFGSNYYLCQNQNRNLDFSSLTGHWLAMQLRVTMNTGGGQNGVYELYLDDCGVNGLGCTGTPTLRSRFTNVRWTPGSDTIKSIWVENQSPPPPDGPARGQQWYDQIKVATVGPIPFVGGISSDRTAPSAPGSPAIR